MPQLRPTPLRFAAAALCLLLAASPSHATLGAHSTPPARGAVVQLRALAPALQAAGVQAQSNQLPNGTSVVEYLRTDGTVFAVTWQGPVLPDLPSLLGTYFPEFQAEARRQGHAARGANQLNLHSTALVLHSQGRMRHFSGSAYAPSLLPTGLDINDVLR